MSCLNGLFSFQHFFRLCNCLFKFIFYSAKIELQKPIGTSEMHRLKLRFTWLVHLFKVKAPPPKASHSDFISTESVKNGWKSSQSRNKRFLVKLWESFAFQMRCSVWGHFIHTRIYLCSSFRFFVIGCENTWVEQKNRKIEHRCVSNS